MIFGIYPGGEAGSETGIVSGPPDNPSDIENSLNLLQRDSRPLIVRAYERFSDPEKPSRWPFQSPRGVERYCRPDRSLDLVLMFQSERGDVAAYLDFVRGRIRHHCDHLYSVQITEEANFTGGPNVIDGPYPNVRTALVEGVVEARRELDVLGRTSVIVGFSATPTFGPDAGFWSGLATRGGDAFRRALGYAGLDFFPDVFRPIEASALRPTALAVLDKMRREWLRAARIADTVPIHITENGWPTGPGRSYDRQAEVVEALIRTIHEASASLNIARYTLFALRDANSSNPDLFSQFGVTRDDYTPKPAFQLYRDLIAEYSTQMPAAR